MTPRTCLLLGIACLALAQTLVSGVLVDMRAKLVLNSDVYEALKPGEFAGTLVLGGFRGLACDLLWMRAQSAKDSGNYYESLALANTITKIQPRFEQVWEYMAYDMAYNISHEIQDEPGRWAWYLAGVDIDIRGIMRDPNSERLIRHLAWLYFHKGDSYRTRIFEANWSGQINQVIALANRGAAQDQQVALLPDASGVSNYQIAERLYHCAINIAQSYHLRILPFEQRMIPIAIDHDGNRLRNRGEHLAALRAYVKALSAWQEVMVASLQPPTFGNDATDQEISHGIAQHNIGRLQRKTILLAEQLCMDQPLSDQVCDDIRNQRYAQAEQALTGPKWHESLEQIRNIRWLDER